MTSCLIPTIENVWLLTHTLDQFWRWYNASSSSTASTFLWSNYKYRSSHHIAACQFSIIPLSSGYYVSNRVNKSISRSPVNSHNVESSSSSTISDRWRMSVREMDILASEKRQVFQDKPQVVQRMKETFIQRNPEAFIVSATRDKAHARAQKSSELGPSIPLSPPLPITAQAVTFPPPLASTQSHGQLSASNWDDFGHLEYPKEWIYDPENPGANVLSLLVALEKVDVRYGSKLVHRITLFGTGHDRIPLPAIVISPDGPPNEQGKSFFEMKRVVDPGKPFSETSSREWCEEGSYKGVEIVTVPQSGIKAQRALGFELCRPPVSPLDPANKDRDRRAAPRVEDTMTLDRPWADTELYMPRGCELLRKQQTMGTWAPVKTLDQIPEAQASSLSFSSFRPAGEIQKLCPATFVGHTHKYPRPNGVGAGWGGYDKFALWQSFGRHVDPSLVEEEDWETDPAAPLHLVSDEGVVEMVIPSVYRKDTSEEPPMSLYEKLHRDKSKWRGGSTADRGRCRGAQRRW